MVVSMRRRRLLEGNHPAKGVLCLKDKILFLFKIREFPRLEIGHRGLFRYYIYT